MPLWAASLPFAGLAALVTAMLVPLSIVLAICCLPALIGSVVAAVHHAEVVAHRVGEPFGTLVLALAITIIEVTLIVSIMLAGGPNNASLPRETIFSTVMIICNGVIGLCLLLGSLRHYEQSFHVEGANAALATIIALATLTLVLPSFTTSSIGPTYTHAQLAFAAIASLVLWVTFAFVQTVRHRDYFLPADISDGEPASHAPPPSHRQTTLSACLLMLALIAVVGLAKVLSPTIEAAVMAVGAPQSVVGIAIAMIVLLPETSAAVRAARANRMQTSLNLALGSAIASIGLTIPAVALASVLMGLPLALGLEGKDLVLLILSFTVASLTLVSGRTHIMQGAVHLVIFAAFLFLSFVP